MQLKDVMALLNNGVKSYNPNTLTPPVIYLKGEKIGCLSKNVNLLLIPYPTTRIYTVVTFQVYLSRIGIPYMEVPVHH